MHESSPAAEIVRLRAGDFDDLNRHLCAAFGHADFAGHLPSLYEPTDASMGRTLAVKEGGRVVAAVGLFDLPWRLGEASLRLAGIGGVSVDAACNGRGLMRRLMDAAVAEIDRQGYAAAYLGGARGRYAHWGFEKGGAEAVLKVGSNSLSHRKDFPRGGAADPALTPVGDGDTEALAALYRTNPARLDRDRRLFPATLRNWLHETGVTRDAAGRPEAYACFHRGHGTVHEFGAADGAALDGLVAAVRGELGGWVSFRLPLLRTPAFERLRELCEDAAVEEAGNWRVGDWPAVLTAAMRLKHSVEGLAAGAAVLRVSDAEGTLRLVVDGDGARCEACDAEPAVTLTAAEAVRALTGPLPAASSAAAPALSSWRPLPLFLPMQDRI